MPKKPCFGKGGLGSFISQFIKLSKPTREKYPNHSRYHKYKNLVLITEAKNLTQRNSSASNVYTFWQADFEGVEFYASGCYVNLRNKKREKYLSVK